jgi:eukaryotic-like serine/threonine-protein kinase
MPPIPCLRAEELRAYLFGDMAGPQSTVIEEHLESCAECEAEAARLEQLSDPVLGHLRRVLHLVPRERRRPDASTVGESSRSEFLAYTELHNATQIGSNYEVLGELGRGGMSVVYKARQYLPERIVALKMILAGAHAGPEQRTRFLAEANAIARLQHPGIVSVFEVGIVDEALFFSMEMMEGGALDDKINATPQPPADAASLVKVVARAVQFAHERGIVHRDLKPANILLTRDGAPKIADFGLARLEDNPVMDDGSLGKLAPRSPHRRLTVTGAILGTPSYMSPEQADGRRDAIGPCTDIYALGAVLYEMLTGRPPFRGTGALDTLELIRSHDPVPPHHLQPHIPRDLETICLKCLARDPGRRYASALDLGDDLDRFQNGQPIRARPVPIWEKVLKRARRHPTASVSAVLAIVATVGLVTTWTIFTVRLRAALDQSHKNAIEADNQRVKAEANQDRAFEGIDRFLTRIADKDLSSIPGMEVVRRDLLNEALEVSQAFLGANEGGSARVRLEVARAHARCAKIYESLLNTPKQLEHFRQAVSLQRGLVNEYPDEPSHQIELAKHLQNLATTLRNSRLSGSVEECEAIQAEVLDFRRRSVSREPDNAEYRWALANSYFSLGGLRRLQPRRLADAELAYENALAIAEGLQVGHKGIVKYRHQMASICIGYGVLLHSVGRREQARRQMERARAIYQETSNENPDNFEAQNGLVMTSNNLGAIYLALNERTLALSAGEDAVRASEQLVRIHRTVPAYRGGLAGAHNNLAGVFYRYGPASLAEEHFRMACSISRDLVRDHPEVGGFRHELGKHLTNLASSLSTQHKDVEARAICQEAVLTLERRASENATDAALSLNLAQARFQLAHLQLSDTGPNADVLALYDSAIGGLEAVLAYTPGHAEARASLHEARQSKACALFLAGSYREVLSILEISKSADWPSKTLVSELRALSLAATADWRQAIVEIRKADITKAAEDQPVELFRLACVETRCAEVIALDHSLSASDRALRQSECEEKAVALINGFALKGETLPVDFETWSSVHRQASDWQVFRTIVETPRFAFILASGYTRAADASKEKADALDRLALEALQHAMARGFFRQPERRQRLATAPDLNRLRRFPAFDELQVNAEKASSP